MKKPMRWILVPAALAILSLTLAARVGLRAARKARLDRNREIASVRAWENEGGALACAAGTPGNRA
jgi:hypothetical protein